MLNIFSDILETEADLKPKQAQFPPPQTGGGRWLVVPEVSSCQKVVLPTVTKWLLIGGGLIVGDFTLKYKTQVVVMWCKMNETELNSAVKLYTTTEHQYIVNYYMYTTSYYNDHSLCTYAPHLLLKRWANLKETSSHKDLLCSFNLFSANATLCSPFPGLSCLTYNVCLTNFVST